jgi:hypothetical protein
VVLWTTVGGTECPGRVHAWWVVYIHDVLGLFVRCLVLFTFTFTSMFTPDKLSQDKLASMQPM